MATSKKRTREIKIFWLSYDLGLRGDYEALYGWLDSKQAKECGDSVATFHSDRTSEELKDELTELLSETSKPRIYLISSSRGSFVIGKRKAAPWAGSFQNAVENALDQ